ncbi:cytochrome c [Tardiphaga sp.]|uniref:c-type cytochrome n=1 Tax=Tardiphaga sp. TaxID=1926292 RepID=UPI0025E4DCBE|nr:cytochrome c [Tardiphaga sp.]
MMIDDFNGDNFDHSGLGFVGGGFMGAGQTGARPIQTRPVPAATPKWGAQWKKATAETYNRAFSLSTHGSSYSYRDCYLDLDTTYKDSCAACHKDSGSGEARLFPKLAGSALVHSDDPTTLAHVVLNGARAVATDGAPTSPAMSSFDWRLNDAQVAAVLTYIRTSWGNAAPPVVASAVADRRSSLATTP